jgi:hypothetical protein
MASLQVLKFGFEGSDRQLLAGIFPPERATGLDPLALDIGPEKSNCRVFANILLPEQPDIHGGGLNCIVRNSQRILISLSASICSPSKVLKAHNLTLKLGHLRLSDAEILYNVSNFQIGRAIYALPAVTLS